MPQTRDARRPVSSLVDAVNSEHAKIKDMDQRIVTCTEPSLYRSGDFPVTEVINVKQMLDSKGRFVLRIETAQ